MISISKVKIDEWRVIVMNDRISFLLVAKNHYMLEIAKYNKRIDKESDKLFAMQKDEGNNSVKQRAKVRTRLSQMADAREVMNKKVAEINNWIEELRGANGR